MLVLVLCFRATRLSGHALSSFCLLEGVPCHSRLASRRHRVAWYASAAPEKQPKGTACNVQGRCRRGGCCRDARVEGKLPPGW